MFFKFLEFWLYSEGVRGVFGEEGMGFLGEILLFRWIRLFGVLWLLNFFFCWGRRRIFRGLCKLVIGISFFSFFSILFCESRGYED